MKKSIFAVATALALACLLALGSTAMAAKGGDKGPPDGGEGAGVNQLSLPAIYTTSIDAYWNVKADPVLGVDYSYGCAEPEASGIYKYSNTSCVDDLMNPTVYHTKGECEGETGKCAGQAVHPIYWQKNPANLWSPDQDVKTDGGDFVEYLDWGDALEAVSWNTRSKIRVETQPYSSTIPEFDPSAWPCAEAAMNGPAVDCKVGFQMWHVSGQGITEHWGVRADEATGDSYNYDSPFQIIKTDNAKLNIAKLESGSSVCPSPGGGEEEAVALAASYEIPDAGSWESNEWEKAVYTKEVSYSVETSVGGKYVYGYNLDMNALAITEGVEKAGWWRLTFYTTDGAVQFYDPLVSDPEVLPGEDLYYYQLTAPPAVPVAARSLPIATGYDRSDRAEEFFITDLTAEVEPAVSELYQPVVDAFNNLTYLDICVVAKDQGGGGGGGGGGGDGGAGIGGGKPSTTKNFDKVRGQGNKGKGHNK